MRTGILAALLFILGLAPAQADTTYNYVGLPYAYNANPAAFGLNMTGSVTFNFDTANVTGAFGLSACPVASCITDAIVDMSLTSGGWTLDTPVPQLDLFFGLSLQSYVVLTSGVITGWDIFWSGRQIIRCDGQHLCSLESQKGGLDAIEPICHLCAPAAVVDTTGQWSLASSVPAPIVGAGIPGLVLISLFGWFTLLGPKLFPPGNEPGQRLTRLRLALHQR